MYSISPISRPGRLEADRSFAIALVASLFLHFVLLLLFSLNAKFLEKKEPEPIKLSLLYEKPKRQIVTTPETSEAPREVDTPLLAERDTFATKESIRRGEEGQAGVALKREEAAASATTASTPTPSNQEVKKTTAQTTSSTSSKQKSQEKTEAQKSAEKVQPQNSNAQAPLLTLNQRDLSKQLLTASKPAPAVRADTAETALRPKTDYQPFRQSLPARVSGSIGSPDYLPTIQDGEVTLLNAKADRYAVFVRRVAIQVFGVLRQLSWTTLNRSQISRLQEFSEVRAILAPDGKLLRVELGGSSGVAEFDTLVLDAARKGAWDRNPPEGAKAADGNIHFIFRSRTWARPAPAGVGEQRWLLLSSGLL